MANTMRGDEKKVGFVPETPLSKTKAKVRKEDSDEIANRSDGQGGQPKVGTPLAGGVGSNPTKRR